jgi:tetratricopeptide (TPR) repeat protein
MMHRPLMHSRIAPCAIIAILVVITYIPIFTGDFLFDDISLIRDNPYITQLQSLASYLSQEDGMVDLHGQGVFHTGYYRPLINLTYFLDYKIWGMKAYGFRATNLILHLSACFMLYALLLRMTRHREACFWTALLFALHPVQTEAVSIIVSRNNILATLFILASLYGYLAWWHQRAPLGLAVSLIGFVGAVFSKEFGLMALPIVFLYHRFLSDERNVKREAASYIPFLMIVSVYFILRATVLRTPLSVPDDVIMRIAYIPYVLAYNLKLIFLPYHLHSFSVTYPASLISVTVMLSYFLVVCLAALLYVLRKASLVVFSATAFVMSLAPVLNLVSMAAPSLIAMRWLYLPLSFLALSMVWLLAKIQDNHRRAARIVLVVFAAYFAFYSYTLNAHLWRDHETFLRQEVLLFANDLYMGDYAEMMLKKKNYPEAEYYFQQSLERRPLQAYNYINYAVLLIDTNRPQMARVILEKARNLAMGRQDRSDWNNNMGAAWALVGNDDRALEYFGRALELNPRNQEAHRNLASLHAMQGRASESAYHLKMADQVERLK